jgi:cytoskeletal protein CcmA (bactofilin family)
MFGNKKSKRSTDLDSLVGANTKLVGDVHFSGGLHIDGTIQGNVIAEGDDSLVTTSEKGRVEGNVHVHNIVLSGEVIGDVYALKHIELAPNARVTGNVYYNLIEMAGGAEVNGSLIHYDNKDHKVEETSSQAEPPTVETEQTPVSEFAAEPQNKVQGGFN